MIIYLKKKENLINYFNQKKNALKKLIINF